MFSSGSGNGIAFNPSTNAFVAVGSTISNTVNIARSDDGRSWTALAPVFEVQGNAVAFSAATRRWVAVGEGSFVIAFSANDGRSWTPIGGLSGVFSSGRAVVFGINGWIVFGGGGTGSQSAFSVDGVSWNATTSPNVFPSVALGAALGPSGCVLAVGDSNSVVATSCNGGRTFSTVPAIFPPGVVPTNTANVTGGPLMIFDSQTQLYILATSGSSEKIAYSTSATNWTLANGTSSLV